jgi:hypothetical protein
MIRWQARKRNSTMFDNLGGKLPVESLAKWQGLQKGPQLL